MVAVLIRTILPKSGPNWKINAVSKEKILKFSHTVLYKTITADGSHFGCTSMSSDTLMKGHIIGYTYERAPSKDPYIPSKSGPNWKK